MKLLSLKLLHYRRFRQEEINFRDDFSLIFWKNGSGKSSVLDAIWYAFFWPTSKDFVRVNRDYLRSYFLREREPSKIELHFQYGMQNYKIVRVIDAWTKKFASEFIIENKDTLYWPSWVEIIGGDEITSYIETLIWVNKETFLRSVFAKQKDLEVLSWWLSQRKELINKVLGLDKIEEIIEQLKKDEKEKKTLLEIYKKKVWDFDEEAVKIKKQDLQTQINDTEENYQNIQKQRQEILSQYEKIKISFAEISDKKNIFTQCSTELSIKNEQLKNLQKNILDKQNELLEIEKQEKYLEENKSIIWEKQKYDVIILQQENLKNQYKIKKDLEQEILQKQQEVNKIQEKIKNHSLQKVKEEIEQSQKNIELFEQSLNKSISSRSTLEVELSQLKNIWTELGKELELLQTLWQDASCPTCKRPLKQDFPNLIALFEKDLKEKREAYKWKQSQLTQIISDIERVWKDIIQTKNRLNILQNLEKDILLAHNQIENYTTLISEISQKLSVFKDINYNQEDHKKIQIEFEKINYTFQEYNKIVWQVIKKQDLLNFIQDALQKLKDIQEEIQEGEKKLTHIGFHQEEYENIKKEFEEGNQKIHLINTQINEIEKIKLSFQFSMKGLIQQEQDFLQDKKQIDIFVREASEFILKKQILSDYILYLLAYMKPRIEDLASEYFSIVTDGKYTSLTLDDDYNIMIDEKNLDLYSGWERDLANLCFRLSLWQNLTSNKWNPINFLILDEVLASQDKQRQENILIHLKKLENKFSQIILISHAEEMKELATHLIEIKSINREESSVFYH